MFPRAVQSTAPYTDFTQSASSAGVAGEIAHSISEGDSRSPILESEQSTSKAALLRTSLEASTGNDRDKEERSIRETIRRADKQSTG